MVISSQHSPDISQEQLHEDIRREVIEKVIPAELLDENTKYYINPTGRFVVGGPQGDSGLTGRKIIVDTYGGIGRHGGGAFSGKDPTKVDRSGAYAARWVAKNIVAAGLAKRCEIQLAYAIGVAEPVSIMVETFGTGVVGDDVLEKAVEKVFDLRPAAIIEQLDLRKPIYKQLAAYGHMGREELGVKWENTDKVEALKAAVNGLTAGGSTNHADAFTKAMQMFDPASGNAKVIVMFTDGNTTAGAPPEPVAAAARAQGIIIYCIGLVGADGVDVNTLNEWASDPDASHVAVTPDAAELERLFANLAANISKPGPLQYYDS